MSTAYVVVTALLAAVLAFSAFATFTRLPQVADNLTATGVKPAQFPILAAIKLAGAIGLVAGFWLPPIGVAAAIGVVLYFVGAVIAHLRVRHYALLPPIALLVVAVAALVLRLVSF